ncbi:hypothetical protein OAO24_00910 [Methylophilaceae bacterium]|nr:hypothetical protein [Methylophilaceae bacterium]|tara:strand:+ start:3252 stop:3704 length:453 start_codon:yes stop_codon:yes gene_type:complete
MKTILALLFLVPSVTFAEDLKLLCKGEEAKYLEEDPGSKEVTTKVIGIQLYEEGMRLNGEWFDNKSDLTEDYFLERSYVKSKDNITGVRNFSTNALIEGREIQTAKIDKVKINIITNDIFWTHEFNRIDKTNAEANTIYAFRKNFQGKCK